MGRKKKQPTIKKEEIAEDYCFICKDGGSIRICDYKNCLKGCHPYCAGKDDSLLETEEDWFCGWHFCLSCRKPAKFHCFCCPAAVCGRCLGDTEFAVVKGKKGFCNTCLGLALLIEDNENINSNGVEVDFNDKETLEFLFKGYWEFVKQKEGLTSKQVHKADRLLRKGQNYDLQANNDYAEDDSDFEDDGDEVIISDNDDLDQVQCRKRKKRASPLTKRKGNAKKMEYLGWASKQLTEFLKSAGKNVMQELSEYDVETIIIQYCNEHKLFHPEKKKKVICDERLRSLLGRKSVNRNGIKKLLTVHFADNLEQSENSVQLSSKEEDDNSSVPCKRKRKTIPDQKFEEKEVALNPRQGYLAAIVSGNIKLVYLKRSLVEELAKHSDTFSGKMMGSFVRVRSDPNDYLQKNPYMLVQVKGNCIKMKEEMNSLILLQVSNMVNDVPNSKLSDDDFTEEECEDLNQRMRTGRLKRPTSVELEQKARSLHEDITKHNDGMDAAEGKKPPVDPFVSDDRCNHSEFVATRVESDETERDRHFQEVKQSCLETFVPHSLPQEFSDSPSNTDKQEEQHGDALASGEKLNQPVDIGESPKVEKQLEVIEISDDETERNQLFQEVKQSSLKTSVPHLLLQEYSVGQGNTINQEKEHVHVEKQVDTIEVSDDEEEPVAGVAMSQLTCKLEDPVWYHIAPSGKIRGPYSITLLKDWSDKMSPEIPFKVMKSGQKPEEAVPLTDAIRQILNS
ncbi:Zinc finger, PHD-type [Corchorus capsularis]|uniref:Zinc finger, PHD-type n=1 Tax=Corchorus capsularis TaxID=210143 RepID=A0A1R3HXR0_COCAP|nr:Zinc finger, PHD-type [Corchorus capsularis]